MKTNNNSVYVLGSNRIPFAKSHTYYKSVSRKELMTAAVNGLIKNCSLDGKFIDDTALGAVMNSSSDFNLAREVILETTLDPNSPAYNIQRACGTGLEAAWQIALKIHTGSINIGIAGGVDTNSDLPIEVSEKLQKKLIQINSLKSKLEKFKAIVQINIKDLLPKMPVIDEPRTKLSMGDHCELMVKEWQIERAEQDEFALSSHTNGTKAYEDGFYNDLVTPYHGLDRDSTLRADTSIIKLSKLKPAYDLNHGTLTAGNSSPLTDGAACVLIGNENSSDKYNIKKMAKIIDFQTSAVDFVHGSGLLMAPTKAVAKLLERNQLGFDDIDFFEIHEAFAGQVLCNLKAWESQSYCKESLGLKSALGKIDRKKINVVGSSLSLGHPFAATGSRILGTLAKNLMLNKNKRGLISICTAGGMGIAALIESV